MNISQTKELEKLIAAKVNEGLEDARAGQMTAYDKKGLRDRIRAIKKNGRPERRSNRKS